jgi:predicted enzyme related to lactoylglutathione lyase
MEILGIDHVVFTVGDLSEAVNFYERLGLRLQFQSEQAAAAVMVISEEHPNLLLKKADVGNPATLEQPRFWVEVRDAQEAIRELKENGFKLAGEPRFATVGWLVEVVDPWGNVMGFIDYKHQPHFGRAGGNTRNRKEKVH